MRKLVCRACDHAWRTRRGNEGRARQQNRGVYRDHWRQNGYATGPRLRPWPTQGHVRRHALIFTDPKQQMARVTLLPPSAKSGSRPTATPKQGFGHVASFDPIRARGWFSRGRLPAAPIIRERYKRPNFIVVVHGLSLIYGTLG